MRLDDVAVTVRGSTPLDAVEYGFDADALDHLMSMLTSIYSDPITAVIREYAANARDSHVEAGQTRPIEVEVGTALNPAFVVRDFGIGLSHDEAMRLFGQYGASTKRDSNLAIGAFGIGSKSGLAYADSMTITARRDGQQSIIVVGRNENGRGVLNLVSRGQTFEPNGVEISIPIRHSDSGVFINRARDFFKFWEAGTVLVNGAEPSKINGDKITDEFLVVSPTNLSNDYLVMGNVPYPISHSQTPFKNSEWDHLRQRVVVFASIGAVSITPNREELKYTDKTIKFLREANTRFRKNLTNEAQAAINACATPGEAFVKAHEWRGGDFVSDQHRFVYRGVEIPFAIQSPQTIGGKRWASDFLYYDPNAYGRRKVHAFGSISPGDYRVNTDKLLAGDVLIVTGYATTDSDGTARSVPSGHRDKMEYYGNTVLNNEFSGFLLADKHPSEYWLESVPAASWDDIKTVKIPKGLKTSSSRGPLPVKIVKPNSYWSDPLDLTTQYDIQDLLDGKAGVSGPYVLVSPSDYKDHATKRMLLNCIRGWTDDYTFIWIGANRHARFKREIDATVFDSVDDWVRHVIKSLDVSQETWDRHFVTELPYSIPEGVDDPDLIWYNDMRKVTPEVAYLRKVMELAGKAYKQVTIGEPSNEIATKVGMQRRYPLLEEISTSRADTRHLAIYLNAAYEREV